MEYSVVAVWFFFQNGVTDSFIDWWTRLSHENKKCLVSRNVIDWFIINYGCQTAAEWKFFATTKYDHVQLENVHYDYSK